MGHFDKKLIFHIIIICVFIFLSPVSTHSETIQLADGKTIDGRLLSVHDDKIIILWGDTEHSLPKSTVSLPGADAYDEAIKAFSRRNYAKASDLCQQILIWDKDNQKARELWKKSHTEEVRYLIGRFNWRIHAYPAFNRLMKIVTEDDLPLLHETLRTHGSTRGRRAATFLVAYIGSEQSIGPLSEILADYPDDRTRREAALALGEIGSVKAARYLYKTMRKDANYDVRTRAAEALNKIGTP